MGEEQIVTIDSAGTLGVSNIASAASVANVRVSVDYLAAVTDAQFSALSGRVSGLESGLVATNFRLDELTEESRSGVAAAMAQAEPPFPPEPGQTGYAVRGATFRGEYGFSLGISHRLAIDMPLTINASVSHSGGSNTGSWNSGSCPCAAS